MSKEYPKSLYCKECKRITNHRIKLDSIQNGCLVCNECDTFNNYDLEPIIEANEEDVCQYSGLPSIKAYEKPK